MDLLPSSKCLCASRSCISCKGAMEKRSNLDLNFNLTGKTLRKLRWKAHEELADVIEFNSDMIRISNGLPTAIYIHFISLWKDWKTKQKNKIVKKFDLMNEQIKPVLMSYHFSAENDSARREVKVEP